MLEEENYIKNINSLKHYPYCFGINTDLMMKKKIQEVDFHVQNQKICKTPKENDRLFFVNEMQLDYINNMEKRSRKESVYKFKKIPFYLFYENSDIFFTFICENDINILLENERIVFIVGEENLIEYFSDLQTVLPNYICGNNYCNIEQLIEKIRIERQEKLKQIQNELINYYDSNKEKIKDNILYGRPKILFIKRRFSFTIKNHTRDSCKAFERLGYDTMISEETSDINRIYREEDINNYKPDIIFDIDHFRYNYDFFVPNVVYITWIQDSDPHLFNSDIPKKLMNRDIILNYFMTFKDMYDKYGYKKEDLLNAPVPGNELIYKKYKLTNEEFKKYACDISYVSNSNDYKKLTNELVKKYDSNTANNIKKFIGWYYKKEYSQLFIQGYQPDVLYQYFEKFIGKTYICVSDIENIKRDLLSIQYAMKKYITAQWLIENKNCTINLWGNDWADIEEFKQYSKGMANNGEELSKIYNASKISIGTHPQTTSSARVFEILLSGSLCIQGYVEKQFDTTPFEIISDGDTKGIVFYRTKEEFFEKIGFYLSQSEEREKVSDYGYQQAREKFTYLSLMDRTIKHVKNKLVNE